MPVLLPSMVAAALLPLFKTLFEIALLRKGPQHIPDSWLVLGMAALWWVIVLLIGIVLVETIDEGDFFPEVVRVLALMAVYSGIVYVSGHGARIVRTITAIIGCGALLSILYIFLYAALGPLLGTAYLNLIVLGFLLWSLAIKGHIIANAMDIQWYLGAMIATAVFVGQRFVITMLAATP